MVFRFGSTGEKPAVLIKDRTNRSFGVVQHHFSTKRKICFFYFSKTMGKKRYCNECAFFKYEDWEGLGWCELLEEADVSCDDEA